MTKTRLYRFILLCTALASIVISRKIIIKPETSFWFYSIMHNANTPFPTQNTMMSEITGKQNGHHVSAAAVKLQPSVFPALVQECKQLPPQEIYHPPPI